MQYIYKKFHIFYKGLKKQTFISWSIFLKKPPNQFLVLLDANWHNIAAIIIYGHIGIVYEMLIRW